jgi:outer membrane lipoprotein LolB
VGQVWNAVEALQIDRQGRPQSFSDRGWRVAYLDYEADTADALPALIQLRRDDLDVKLRIDQWNLAP